MVCVPVRKMWRCFAPQLLQSGAIGMDSQVSLSLEMEHPWSFFPFFTCMAQVKIRCLQNVFPFKSPSTALFSTFMSADSITASDSLSHSNCLPHKYISHNLLRSCPFLCFSLCYICFLNLWKGFVGIFLFLRAWTMPPLSLSNLFFFLMSTKPDIPNLSSHLYLHVSFSLCVYCLFHSSLPMMWCSYSKLVFSSAFFCPLTVFWDDCCIYWVFTKPSIIWQL